MKSQSPFLIEQPSSELEFVNEFHLQSELLDVRLKGVQAKAGEIPEKAEGKLKLDLNHRVKDTRVCGQSALFEVVLEMKASVESDAAFVLFELECCLEAVYALKPGFAPSQRHFETFGRGNLLLHCWPYLREFVHNITWRMGLALPPLPLLRVIPTQPAKEPKSTGRGTGKKTVLSSR